MRTMYILRIDDRPTSHFGKFSNGHISATGRPIHFMFGSRVWFSRSADRMAKFPVAPNPRWRLAAILKISNGHISGTGRPTDFVFDPRVGFSVMADRMDLLPVGPNPIWRLAAILVNFEWPYLGNGSSDPLHLWF